MTKEEAARILDPETSAKVLREYGDGNAQIEACDEACRIAAAELRRTGAIPGTPLTAEELQDMEGQKVLIYRMKSTEPLEPGTVKRNGDVLGDAGMLAYHELYLETWVAFSYQAQEKPDFDKPLTLEQLRGMDDQPVKVKNLKYAEGGLNTGVVTMYDPNDSDNGVYVGCTFFCIKDYGKIWLAYACPPAHIDREAFCGSWEGEADGYADGELVYDVWRCSGCGHVEENDDPDLLPDFCPDCGLALTEKARAILEKRLRG